MGGSDGGASVLDLHSGALSYGTKFINVYSLEESKEIFTKPNLAVYKIVKEKVKTAIADLFGISANVLYLTHPTFFSRLDNRDPITEHDEYWQIHVDKVIHQDNYRNHCDYEYNLCFIGYLWLFLLYIVAVFNRLWNRFYRWASCVPGRYTSETYQRNIGTEKGTHSYVYIRS